MSVYRLSCSIGMIRFNFVWVLVMLCILLLLTRTNQQITKGEIRSCISCKLRAYHPSIHLIYPFSRYVVPFFVLVASEKLKSRGLGNTPQSCMDCDPALPRCSSGCQGLVKDLYYNCDAICLPRGYYFNPSKTCTPSNVLCSLLRYR